MSETISNRERAVLVPAVLYGWKIEPGRTRGRSQNLLWDGDVTLPFKATASLESLVKKGLMELCLGHYRRTDRARDYACISCHRGRLYNEDHEETGKCTVCDGTGLLLSPRRSPTHGD